MLAKLIDGLVEIHPHIPVCMHLDHGNNEATCVTAIQYGFTSVMMDGSLKEDGKTPADYAYNSGITKHVSRWRIGAASRSKARSACSARWRAAGARRRTATASKARSPTTSS